MGGLSPPLRNTGLRVAPKFYLTIPIVFGLIYDNSCPKYREGSHGIKTDPISQGDVGFCVFGIPEASEINFSREDTDSLMLG